MGLPVIELHGLDIDIGAIGQDGKIAAGPGAGKRGPDHGGRGGKGQGLQTVHGQAGIGGRNMRAPLDESRAYPVQRGLIGKYSRIHMQLELRERIGIFGAGIKSAALPFLS